MDKVDGQTREASVLRRWPLETRCLDLGPLRGCRCGQTTSDAQVTKGKLPGDPGRPGGMRAWRRVLPQGPGSPLTCL